MGLRLQWIQGQCDFREYEAIECYRKEINTLKIRIHILNLTVLFSVHPSDLHYVHTTTRAVVFAQSQFIKTVC